MVGELVYFPDGLIGFTSFKYFILKKSTVFTPYYKLISIEDTEVNFLLINPYLVVPDYVFDIDDNVKNKLDTYLKENLLQFVIVTVPDELELISINLRMPILINDYNNRGHQLLLGEQYPIKLYILYKFNELKENLLKK